MKSLNVIKKCLEKYLLVSVHSIECEIRRLTEGLIDWTWVYVRLCFMLVLQATARFSYQNVCLTNVLLLQVPLGFVVI